MKGGESTFVSLMQEALGLSFHQLHPWWSVYLVFDGSENIVVFQTFPQLKWPHEVQTSGRWDFLGGVWHQPGKRNQVVTMLAGKRTGRFGKSGWEKEILTNLIVTQKWHL